MKETFDRSHSALTCMAHEILSWTYLQSGNLHDSRQHRASCTQRSDKMGRPRSPFSGCPTYRKRRQCNATGELSKRGKGGCSSHSSPQGGGTEAADPELYYRHGSSPRAEQDALREGRRSERKASSPKVCCKNVAFGNLTRSFKRGQI